jgi:hypothetical protein
MEVTDILLCRCNIYYIYVESQQICMLTSKAHKFGKFYIKNEVNETLC